MVEEQEYCLRWNNFQANITTQFEALRVDQDFTDVSIVCDGGIRIQAHRVVLSACSPLFKELFKNNPCTHPIIFMRDVDEYSVRSLLMFMYAGEVNVAQAHFANFLRTAESLQIRGLTEPNTNCLTKNPQILEKANEKVAVEKRLTERKYEPENNNDANDRHEHRMETDALKQMKIELPEFSEYFSDVDEVVDEDPEAAGNITEDINLDALGFSPLEPIINNFKTRSGQTYGEKDKMCTYASKWNRDVKYVCEDCGQIYNNISYLRQHMKFVHFPKESLDHKSTPITRSKLSKELRRRNSFTADERMYPAPPIDATNSNHMIKLADGIEVHSEQLRGMKWNDYKKLTRGLATILFRPEELASCSVTGQRWSRAGSDLRRPVKPALDRAKVQAIISYVATRFPNIEISRIKQVLAYKCKENSTAFKMKAVRYFADQIRDGSTT